MRKFLLLLFILLANILQVNAQATYPVNDVANPKEACYAFINAMIIKDVQTTLQNATMVIRRGKIEAVGNNIAIPKDAVVVDCKGKYIYPSFIDMYSDYGTQPAQPAQRNFGGPSQMLSNTKGAYGLSKEEALSSITLNAAKILGIDARTGSLEKGKDANIVISDGDILDMKSSNITAAWIQGREINLDTKQKQLFERYKYKYGIK